MPTLTTDPIITAASAQTIFDVPDEDTMIYLLNSLSAKARAFFGRVQLNEDLSDAVVERLRNICTDTIYLHAPVNTSDFDTYDLKVEVYSSGVVSQTYLASLDEVIVTSDDFASHISLNGGSFPETSGSEFIEVTYFGGWESIPGDVYAGAIMQGRMELKRMAGEVGMSSHSAGGESVSVDQQGVLTEVAAMWQPYRMLV